MDTEINLEEEESKRYKDYDVKISLIAPNIE